MPDTQAITAPPSLRLSPTKPGSLEVSSDSPLVTVQQEATLLEVVECMAQHDSQSCVLVLKNETLVGLVTERDIVRLLVSRVPLETPIAEGMTSSLTVLPSDAQLETLEILDLMRQRQIHHLPIVDTAGKPVGLITANAIQTLLAPPQLLKLQSVRSVMSQQLVMANATDSAFHVASLLAEYQVNCAVIMEDDTVDHPRKPIGLILRQDIIQMQARTPDLDQLSVQTVMQDSLFWLTPSDSLWLAYQEMQQRHLPCLLVLQADGTLMGAVTQTDLLWALDSREVRRSSGQLWQSFRQSEVEQVELWKNRNAELERMVQARTEQLEEQAKCDRVLTTLTQRIHQSLDLQEIFNITTSEVRQLLQADRTCIYRFDADNSGSIVVESVQAPWDSILGLTIKDDCFAEHWAEAYRYGRIQAVVDIEKAGMSPCHIEMLTQFQVRANLVVPIVCDHTLWGLLVVHQCSGPRRWRRWEIQLMEQLVHSVAIAIRQSELYQHLQRELAERKLFEIHLQQLNDELEHKVEVRTQAWRQVADQLLWEISHRNQVEQALAQTNSQLQAVLDAVPGMVSWVNADLVYLGCNRQLAEAFELTPADFIGQKIGFIAQTSQFNEFAKSFFASEDDTASAELKLEVNGTTKHYLMVTQKYDQGRSGVFVGIDISDQEEFKSALQESETKFRSLVEQTNDWVWEIDQQSQLVYVNPRATEIIGYTAEELLGQQFSNFMTCDEAVRFTTILSHLIQQQQPFNQIEVTCIHKNQQPVVLEISGSPVFTSDGNLQGYRGITRDITVRKQVEVDIRKALTKEKELSELKTRFISMASHEFRTPLTTILASAETLERYHHKLPEEKQQVVLKRIQTSVHHVITLLNDVLTVGKAEASKLAFAPESIDLKQFCSDLVEELQLTQTPPVTPIDLVYSGKRFKGLADEKLLRHMLINLLSNAIKYSPSNDTIEFELDSTGPQVLFRVTDHGIGICKEDQDRLFEAFHRGSNVGNISGTGLGLIIAKRAAEAHGGNISCVSEVGVGTTFTVALPLTLWSEDHG